MARSNLDQYFVVSNSQDRDFGVNQIKKKGYTPFVIFLTFRAYPEAIFTGQIFVLM